MKDILDKLFVSMNISSFSKWSGNLTLMIFVISLFIEMNTRQWLLLLFLNNGETNNW